MNWNKIQLGGRLTREPELRYTPNNTAVCAIGVAVNRRWKDQSGQQQEEVTFVDCEAWGRTAEIINEHLAKGRPIFIEGRLKLDQWQDKEGNNRSRLKVVVEQFQFVDSKSDQAQQGQQQPAQARQEPQQQQQQSLVSTVKDTMGATEIDADSIPF